MQVHFIVVSRTNRRELTAAMLRIVLIKAHRAYGQLHHNLRNRIGNISRDPHYTYIFVAATPCYAFCKRQARPFVETRGKNAGFLEGNILMSGLMPFRTFCGPCTVLFFCGHCS